MFNRVDQESKISRTPRLRPGPKIKAFEARPYKQNKSVRRIERSYPKWRKIDVLLFLTHYRVKDDQKKRSRGSDPTAHLTPPTYAEDSAFWTIPLKTIATWWMQRDQILASTSDSRMAGRVAWICKWEELEKVLFDRFCTCREAGMLIQQGWFRRNSQALFKQVYPDSHDIFTFSYGWFAGFVRRHNISNRKVTKQATKLPHEYTACVNSFLRFIKRNSQPHGPSDMRILMEPSCFTPSTLTRPQSPLNI